MKYFAFVHEFDSSTLSRKKISAAIEFSRNSVQIIGPSSAIKALKSMFSSQSWEEATKLPGNPFVNFFGNSMTKRYTFAENEDGEEILMDFVAGKQDLRSERVRLDG